MTDNSQFNLIKNKETVQGIEDSIPHVIPQVGVKSTLEKVDGVKIDSIEGKTTNKVIKIKKSDKNT